MSLSRQKPDPCTMMRDAVKQSQAIIDRNNERSLRLGDLIEAILAAPTPDMDQVQALRNEIDLLSNESQRERGNIANLEIDISMFC